MHLFSTISSWMAAFSVLAKGNPVVAGLAGLFGMSAISFFLVKVPGRLWGFIKRQSTTSLTFNNGNDGNNLETFSSFMKWFQTNHWKHLVRSYAIDGSYWSDEDPSGITVGVGLGSHFFIWHKHLFWLHRENQTAASVNSKIMTTITITMVGRNRQILLDMIETFRYKPRLDAVGIYRYSFTDGWSRIADVDRRDLATVFIDASQLKRILKTYDYFLANRKWYNSKGFPYKLTMLFHGRSGTGKTSLTKALASHYNKNLCLVNLAAMSDGSLESALATAPANSIIAMEDFDSSSATAARAVNESPSRQSDTLSPVIPNLLTPAKENGLGMGLGLTLSGLLNALDGLLSLDGRVIILTTNHVVQMDPALLRKGRIDLTEEIVAMDDAVIRRYIRHMFPEYPSDLLDLIPTFAPILGCDAQDLYLRYHDDADGFVQNLPLHPVEEVDHVRLRCPTTI